MKTLRDCLPYEATVYETDGAYKHLDVEVIEEVSSSALLNDRIVDNPLYERWPGKHKNVFCWWKLKNGKAVGWNENPAIGWSFPVINYK